MTDIQTGHYLSTEISDLLKEHFISLERAKVILEYAMNDFIEYAENRNEAAYDDWHEGLAERMANEGEAYREKMIDAGRGHLVK